MPIFFESSPEQPATSTLEPLFAEAVNLNPTALSITERTAHAKDLASRAHPPRPKPKVVWWRVLVAFVLLVALFFAALWTAKTPEYAKASETLLHCFELLFTATLGLFGIEAAKNG